MKNWHKFVKGCFHVSLLFVFISINNEIFPQIDGYNQNKIIRQDAISNSVDIFSLNEDEVSTIADTIRIPAGRSKNFNETVHCSSEPTNYIFNHELPNFVTFEDLGVRQDVLFPEYYRIKFRILISDSAVVGDYPVQIRYSLLRTDQLVLCSKTFSFVISIIPPVSPFPKHTITDSFYGAFSVHAADVDADGDTDVLGAAIKGDEIAWWENDGSEDFVKHTIDESFNEASTVYATDMDRDGDMDVLGSSYYNGLSWWENDGLENFTKHLIMSGTTYSFPVNAIDVDEDGDIDIVGGMWKLDEVAWWENNGAEDFTKHIIDESFSGVLTVYATDVDHDGDIDVLGSADFIDGITWWENDGSENFTKHLLEDYYKARSIYASDLDGDQDIDVLGALWGWSEIAWWENDGSEGFAKHTIDDNFGFAWDVYAADIDGDGDIDVLGSAKSNKIAWWENNGSKGFTKHMLDEHFNEAYSVYAADVDGDEDMDILGTAEELNEIAWWENIGKSLCTITVISPNGGESWEAENAYDIQWSSGSTSGIVKIDYSTNSGNDWSNIVDSTADDGSHLWPISEEINSSNCLVRISDVNDNTCSDISNADFVIEEPFGSTGLRDGLDNNLRIYPNPTNDAINIETYRLGQYYIEISSLNGQLLYSKNIEGPTHQIELSSFQKGLYFIVIRSRDYVRIEKIFKQ